MGFWCLYSARHRSSLLDGNRTFKGQTCWKLGWTRFPETEYLPAAIKNSSGPFSAGWMNTGLTALASSGTASSVDARSKMRLPENLCKQSKRCSTPVARTQILPGPLIGSQAFPAGLSDPCLCPVELSAAPLIVKKTGIRVTHYKLVHWEWNLDIRSHHPVLFLAASLD